MGWRGSLLDAQLSDLLRAWVNFLAGDFWRETQEWGANSEDTNFLSKHMASLQQQCQSHPNIPASLHCVAQKGSRYDWSSADTPLAGSRLPFLPSLLSSAYPWRILLHLVLVAMGTTGMPPPEAVLTELVIMTLLAAVAEAHHTLSMAVGALDRVKDCREERRGQTNTHADGQTQAHKRLRWSTQIFSTVQCEED